MVWKMKTLHKNVQIAIIATILFVLYGITWNIAHSVIVFVTYILLFSAIVVLVLRSVPLLLVLMYGLLFSTVLMAICCIVDTNLAGRLGPLIIILYVYALFAILSVVLVAWLVQYFRKHK